MLRKGNLVILSEEAVENYGEQYRGRTFKIEQWYDHYVSSKHMLEDEHGHPGYDTGVGGYLYDVSIADTREEFGNSLYDWELIQVTGRGGKQSE